ncbi:dynein light chain Tctex-type 4-like [Perognathus longimembris pacificus]|uniref:dynein light chain Tctex-type 4-like n=1 Tax=Perognathus longimembris pacificus TaxID=214514 RepID=UPI002019101F|nr:dynein light chain Tctex-type 4-like [Perognathus longimembris pacificus]
MSVLSTPSYLYSTCVELTGFGKGGDRGGTKAAAWQGVPKLPTGQSALGAWAPVSAQLSPEDPFSNVREELVYESHLPEMMSQKASQNKDKISQEFPDKSVTFTASSSWANGKKVAGHAGQGSSTPSPGSAWRRGVSRAPGSSEAGAAKVSLRGLLAARRLTRELKSRTSSKTKAQPPVSHGCPVSIIQEQVPLWSARPEVKFPCAQAEELMQAHLPSKLASVAYHPALCAHLATVLSVEIRDLVKAVTPPRYKIVCSVSIGSKGQADVVVSSQSLWDPHTDCCATSCYVNPTLFCVALVHAIYLE